MVMKPTKPRFAELRPHIARRKSKSAVPMQEQKSCCCVATDTEMADRARCKSVKRDAGNERGRQLRRPLLLVLYDTVDFRFSDFDCQRSACRSHTGFVFAVAKFHFPPP